ncbi:MAG: nucleotide pyrophosphohydrolase [Bacteroidota bacterium]|nr:nucleotide pyrophosphohydrolase [Bacteroidota bacterium]
MIRTRKNTSNFDDSCIAGEQIPRHFSVSFKEVGNSDMARVRVVFDDGNQVGDVINDNAYQNDFYRYHDIFHYSFATLLGWSPCARAMMRRKRKSDQLLDEVEDGARAAITEEAISMIIFNEAKRKDYFAGTSKISRTTLKIVKEMTENYEVRIRTTKEWENAIIKAYEIFRLLITNNGGRVDFNLHTKEIQFSPIN